MSYCFALSFCVFWFLLPKPSLVAGQGYDLHLRINIPLDHPTYLATYSRENFSAVLVSTQSLSGAICMLDVSALKHSTPRILFDRLIKPQEVQISYEFFMEPALVVTHGDTSNPSEGEILVVDVTDFNDLVIKSLLPKEGYAYDNPYIVSKVEMVTNVYTKVRNEVKAKTIYLYGDILNRTWNTDTMRGPWEPDTISNLVVIKAYDKSSTYVVFACLGGNELVMIYTGGGRLAEGGVKMEKMKETNVLYLNTFDANSDHLIDLIVTTDNNNGEVLIYEVPTTKAFTDLTKYKKHKILTNFMTSRVGCPTVVKPFYPSSSYSGKPYMLIAGKTCSKASYLVPYWPLDKENWDYYEVLILKDVKSTPGIDSVDLDLDGFSEVFISLTDQHIIKVFSFKVAVAGSRISFELPLNFMIFCHVFAIFCTYF